MSLIPLDEQRGDGPTESSKGPRDSSLVRRCFASVKALLLALPGTSALRRESPTSGTEPPAETDEGERNAPATLPSRSHSGQVEVVSTETADRLTVEAVDNPDATISSDTWEPVER